MRVKREPEAFRPYTITIETRAEHDALVDGLWRRYHEYERSACIIVAQSMYDTLMHEIG